jgi:protein-S-isoprenylcysteine O-methyltransferase Ste14
VEPAGRASSRFLWPPTIYGIATVVSALLAWLVRLPFVPEAVGSIARDLGFVVIICGALLVVLAGSLFRRAGTPIEPTKPSTALVTSGIYRWSRNPMYLGLSAILLGIGLVTGSLWFVVALPVAIFAVTKLAIEPEERYLAELFGNAYLDYKSRVRRWF